MTPKRMYEHFQDQFPWFVSKVDKFRVNKREGGIDIFMNDGSVLNYQYGRDGWILKKGARNGQ